jgi:hypothetical protein
MFQRAGLCLCPKTAAYSVGPIDRASHHLRNRFLLADEETAQSANRPNPKKAQTFISYPEVELTIHFDIVPWLRMTAVVPSLLRTYSWRDI